MSVVIQLQGERPMSWNTFYAGKHWSMRQEEADRVHALVACHCIGYTPFTRPVDIRFYVGFKSRPIDPDNVATKLYIDGMKGRVLTDDTHKQIRSVTIEACKSVVPFVTITVSEVADGN
jgi:hypothetical protein